VGGLTALKPIENRNVRGVASERYPVNEKCAHPECSEPATVHHIFPRSMIKSDSYFVVIDSDEDGPYPEPIPHAVGLCGSGTSGHHGDVEEHRAWIKYEDGEFVWYDRRTTEAGDTLPFEYRDGPTWDRLGPLNPQPGSREGKPKRKRFKGEKRRTRKVITMRVPADEDEDGAAQWDEVVEIGRELLALTGLIEEDEAETYPVYHTIMAVANKGLEALREESRSG